MLQSIVVVGVTLLVIGFSLTQSLFRDVETSQTSQFVVGTLDLSVVSQHNTAAESIQVTNIGSLDSSTGSKTWVIKNTGSLPGKLTISLDKVVNQDNGCNEPEALVDTSCDNPGVGQGELGDAIALQLSLDGQQLANPVVATTLGPTSQAQFAQQWTNSVGKLTIPPGAQQEMILSWSIAPGNHENELQSDSVKFDVIFDLQQMTI